MNIKKENTRFSKLTRNRYPSTRGKKKIIKNLRRQRVRKGSVVKRAQNRLKGFRQASILAVAITGIILLMFTTEEAFSLKEVMPNTAQDTTVITINSDTVSVVQGTEHATGEAIGALQGMWSNFIFNYPKLLIAIGILVIAWLVARLVKFILRTTFRKAKSRAGIVTLTSIAIWMVSVGIAFSVVVGDIRALVGSFGLIGLALSWALQTPIESFTGWLMNAFRRYYQVGDRILVGDVFGDVYRIDFLSTTVWEIGSPYQPGFVNAEQPTGRLVTFPNNEILTGTVINLTGDFPYVWDELDVVVANESDIPLAMSVLHKITIEVVGDYMRKPAETYAAILKRAGFTDSIPDAPEVFISSTDSGTNVIIRYLVGARERRKWKTALLLKITSELNKPEYKEKIIPVYPRQQIQIIDSKGISMDFTRTNPIE